MLGTTGYDYTTMKMPESVEEQTRNCMKTIQKTLQEAGFDLADIVRCRYCLTDRSYVSKVFPILGEYFGEIRPAATMIICGLVELEMKVEIDVTAQKRKL
jgi:enamine deaminase RidA (YjgF/YER057c/UK114 family)